MSVRVCPECDKAFLIANIDYCPPCPMCGYVLVEQRDEDRKNKRAVFTFKINGKKRQGKVLDLSMDGARISYKGSALPVNTILEFTVDKLNIRRPAKAVWTRRHGVNTTQTGLRLI